MCKNLAAQGFNICIVARDEKKMQEKCKEVEQAAIESGMTGIKTMSVKADFAALTTIEDYEKVASQLKDIDVGILVCNAGFGHMGPFKDIKASDVERLHSVNGTHVVYLIKAMTK